MSKRSDGGAPEGSGAAEEQQVGKGKGKGKGKEAGSEPQLRSDQLEIGSELAYPDDGPLSRPVRRVDLWIGRVEQTVLVALLAAVVLTAAGHVLLDRLAGYPLTFKDDVIRGGTFAIALIGAAFASHQARQLSMDLDSRRLSPRARLFLKVILALYTVAIRKKGLAAFLSDAEIEKDNCEAVRLICPGSARGGPGVAILSPG